MALFEVSTISMFRHKFVVEADSREEALRYMSNRLLNEDDSSKQEPLPDVTQKFISETIVDIDEISWELFHENLIKYANDESESSSHWMGEELILKAK